MINIWNHFNKDGRVYWNSKENTLNFWKAVSDGRKFVIFDLETTGLKKNADVIVEFSAIVVEKVNGIYDFTEFVEYYIKPPFVMTPEVVAVHGITNEFLEDKPLEEEIWPLVKDFFERHSEDVICGYNVGFDTKFMEVWAKRHKDEFAPKEVIDMFAMVKENIFFDEHEGNRKLSDILSILYPAKQYKFHDASDDIKATWDVGKGILTKFVEQKPVPEYAKPTGQLISYEYWSMGKTQRLYCTIKVDGKYYEIYYDIYQSCWVCDTSKNEDVNVFLYVNMENIEEQFQKIAESKGKKKFRLLRDKDDHKHWNLSAS